MVQTIKIECPCCRKLNKQLTYWKTVANINLFICDSCLEQQNTIPIDKMIEVGMFWAVSSYKTKLKEAIGNIK